MGFDIGAGLSEMGKSISTQAGQYGLAEQRAQLEMEKDRLASQLAEGVQTRVLGVKAGYDEASDKRRDAGAMDRLTTSEAGDDRRQKEGHKNTLEEISARTKGQITAAAAEHGMQASDFAWVETDDSTGKKFGVSRSGKKVDLGITGPNDADEKLLARAERFALVKTKTDNATTGDTVTEDNIDPVKAAEFLNRQGRGDLAKAYQAPKAPAVPAAPKGVPAGSQYSPSRKMWRDPQGKLYDANGAPAGGGQQSGGLINMPAP